MYLPCLAYLGWVELEQVAHIHGDLFDVFENRRLVKQFVNLRDTEEPNHFQRFDRIEQVTLEGVKIGIGR